MLPFLPILEIELHFELQHIWDITRERGEQLQSAESLITPVMTARDVPVGKKGFTLAQNTHSYLLSVSSQRRTHEPHAPKSPGFFFNYRF